MPDPQPPPPPERASPAPTKPAASHIHTHASQRVDRGKARRPMLEWFFYALGLGALITVVAGGFIIEAVEQDLESAGLIQREEPDEPDIPGSTDQQPDTEDADQSSSEQGAKAVEDRPRRATFISIIILAIFGFAVVKNFFDIRFIHRQSRLTDKQIDILRQTNNIYVFLQSSEPSLFRDHIDNLHEIFRRDCNISQDNLVTLLQSRLLAKTRLVEFCSSILVTLGLVGTIIGLIQSAGGLSEVFTAMTGDEGSFMQGVDAALGGMGIAFYTTLMGAILGGVCLRLLSNLVDANTEHIVSHIAELTEIYILPILRRAGRINEEHQAKLREKGVGLPAGVPVPGTVGTGQTTTAPMPASGPEDLEQ